MTAIGALHLATRRAAPYLAQAAGRGQEFGRLTLAELADNPPAGTTGWLLNEAWKQMMSTPDVGRALTHKVLHHKRPALFPLLDRQTADVLRLAGQPHGWNAWQVLWADIDGSRADFEELRAWFAELAAARDGVPLELLRLHDIPVWLQAAGQWNAAVMAGKIPGTKILAHLADAAGGSGTAVSMIESVSRIGRPGRNWGRIELIFTPGTYRYIGLQQFNGPSEHGPWMLISATSLRSYKFVKTAPTNYTDGASTGVTVCVSP